MLTNMLAHCTPIPTEKLMMLKKIKEHSGDQSRITTTEIKAQSRIYLKQQCSRLYPTRRQKQNAL